MKKTVKPLRKHRWEVGDIIQSGGAITRKIIEVRSTGYSWFYPEWEFDKPTPGGSVNNFVTENSSDPFLEHGRWVKIDKYPEI